MTKKQDARPPHLGRLRRTSSLTLLTVLLAGGCAAPATTEGEAEPATVTVTQTAAPTASVAPEPPPAVTTPEAAEPPASAAVPAPVVPAAGVVPAVVGLDHQLAQDTMQAAGFFNLSEEDATGAGRLLINDRNWVVVEESPAAGTTATPDTTIILRSKKQGE